MLSENRPFDAYIEPARRRSEWWRVLIGLIVAGAIWFGSGIAFFTLVGTGALTAIGIEPDAVMTLAGEGRTMPPAGVMVFLLTFLGVWVGLWIVVRLLHRRPFGTLFHPSGAPLWRNMLGGVVLALGFYAISMVVYIAVLGLPERTDLPISVWLPWIVPILVGVVFQATSEELMFRGYILQQFAVWSRHPVVWAVVPSLVFAALHYDGGMEPGQRTRMLIHVLVFGLIAAALVWRTGGLGAAAGLHVANNWLAIAGIGVEGTALGYELWLFPPDTLERMFVFDLALGLAMLAAVVFFRRPAP